MRACCSGAVRRCRRKQEVPNPPVTNSKQSDSQPTAPGALDGPGHASPRRQHRSRVSADDLRCCGAEAGREFKLCPPREPGRDRGERPHRHGAVNAHAVWGLCGMCGGTMYQEPRLYIGNEGSLAPSPRRFSFTPRHVRSQHCHLTNHYHDHRHVTHDPRTHSRCSFGQCAK